jgi:hypothetical protein
LFDKIAKRYIYRNTERAVEREREAEVLGESYVEKVRRKWPWLRGAEISPFLRGRERAYDFLERPNSIWAWAFFFGFSFLFLLFVFSISWRGPKI